MKSADVIDFAPYKAKQMVNVFSNTGKIDLGEHIIKNQINFDLYLDYLDRATNHEYQNHFISMIIQHAKNVGKENANTAVVEGRELIKKLGFFKYDFQSSLIPESLFERNQIVYLFGELERILYKELDKLDEMDYDYINLLYEHKDALSSIFKTTIQEFGDYIFKWQFEPSVVNTVMMMTESRSYLVNCVSIMNRVLEIHQEIK
jgi:hypothetical protein